MTRRLDAGTLELGDGLEILLAAALEGVAAGEVLEVVSDSRATALELPAWTRLEGHEVDGEAELGAGPRRRYAIRIRRGPFARVLADPLPSRRAASELRRGEFHTADWRRGPIPESADPQRGLAPIDAIPERGGPAFDWRLNRRDGIWADDVADLAKQASAAQWDASVDVPWDAALGLPDFMEQAVTQVMTFIAQNEYAAYYVPATFAPEVNPAYTEHLLWLASHIHDEARHIEVFTKRALLGGGTAYALASTELSLHTLLEERDFSAAALLLNVLGEGTFLDLLRFVEHYAPDPATEAAARLAHRDERRHVHFGISHVRRVVERDPAAASKLVAAAEARATKLTELSGLSPMLREGLTIMAAGSLQPAEISDGAAALRGLMARMEENRVRRLRSAGFEERAARYLSDLHTPNLM